MAKKRKKAKLLLLPKPVPIGHCAVCRELGVNKPIMANDQRTELDDYGKVAYLCEICSKEVVGTWLNVIGGVSLEGEDVG